MSARMPRPLERFAWITLILVLTGGNAYDFAGGIHCDFILLAAVVLSAS